MFDYQGWTDEERRVKKPFAAVVLPLIFFLMVFFGCVVAFDVLRFFGLLEP